MGDGGVVRVRAAQQDEKSCERCRFFVQHYVKVPFRNGGLYETDDGYCICKRRKNVRCNWVCDLYAERRGERR